MNHKNSSVAGIFLSFAELYDSSFNRVKGEMSYGILAAFKLGQSSYEQRTRIRHSA